MKAGAPKMKVVTVTPETAKRWLASKLPNRHINPTKVRGWLSAMRSGHWQIGVPLYFNREGRLMDGQHRLTALIEYGSPLEFLVIEADDDLMLVLDTGAKRDARDVVVIAGITDVRDHATWTRTILTTLTGTEPSHDGVLAYLPKLKPALDALTLSLAGKRGRERRAGIASAFVVAWHDPAIRGAISLMARRYVEGDALPKGTGLWHLREHAREGTKGGSSVMRADMHYALRCIGIEVSDRTVAYISSKSDLSRWWTLLPPVGGAR